MCTRHLTNSVYYLHWNHPEPHRPYEPEPSGTSLAMTRTVRKLVSFCHFATELSTNRAYCLHRKPLQFCLLSAPRLSGTSSAICTGTLRNPISHLHRNPPEPHQPSARNPPEPHQPSTPEPSRTSSDICTGNLRNLINHLPGTRRNLISHLHRNPPEPCLLSAPEPSGTSSAICTGTRRNPPEHSPEPGVAAAPDRTRAILG